MAKLANSGEPDQLPHSASSDLGLHCLPVTLFRISRVVKSAFSASSIIYTLIELSLFVTEIFCFIKRPRYVEWLVTKN